MARDTGVASPKMKLSQMSSFGKKAALVIDVVDGANTIYLKGKEFYRRHLMYSVAVSEKDLLYGEVLDWLMENLPEDKNRNLTVSTTKSPRGNGGMEVAESDDSRTTKPQPLVVRFNERATRKAIIEGHIVEMDLRIPEMTEKSMMSREPEWASIHFAARSRAGQKAVIKKLEELNAQRVTTRKANLKMMNQWGSWRTRSDLPPRTMDSVILPKGQKERIADNLREFLAAEEHYNRLALPWHRGYMFHGPPGTGKTSLVKALANEFNLDLWYLSLSDLKAESSLLGLLSEVGPRSILLLEDIDIMKITHDRDGADQGTISMSSLLNTLDGVATPHGLISIMTTNNFEVLDPALTRAGRMDMIEKLDYPSLNSIIDMFEYFYGEEPSRFNRGIHPDSLDIPIQGLSTSQIAEIMKRHLKDPRGAAQAISEELESYELVE